MLNWTRWGWPYRAKSEPYDKYSERKRALNNALVMKIDCEGCMAHDHQFRWIGKVVRFEESRLCPGGVAVIQIIKKAEAGDWRDADLGTQACAVADGSVQELSDKFFIWYA